MRRISEILGEPAFPEGLDRLYLQDVLDQDLKVFAFQERQGRFRDFLLCLVSPNLAAEQPTHTLLIGGEVCKRKLRAAKAKGSFPLICRFLNRGRYYDVV